MKASFIVGVCLVGCLAGCLSADSNSNGYPPNDLAYPRYDLGYPPYGDLGYPPGYDAAFPGDLACPPCFDFATPPFDFGFPGFDFGFPPPPFDFGFPRRDFGRPIEDLAQPPVQDFARTPDLAGNVAACEQCIGADCGMQVATCQGDQNCVTTLTCVVQAGCFTYAGGSSSFASCVDGCIGAEGLTLPQTVQVLSEIGALSSCVGSCVDTCGGQ